MDWDEMVDRLAEFMWKQIILGGGFARKRWFYTDSGDLFSQSSPGFGLLKWDGPGSHSDTMLLVRGIHEKYGYILSIEGPFEDDRWIVNILNGPNFESRETIASAIENDLDYCICKAIFAMIDA